MRTYSELMTFKNYGDRLAYLQLWDNNSKSPRYMSNRFYKSRQWLDIRSQIILRDFGCDLGDLKCPIEGIIIVHHMNPVTEEELEEWSDDLFNPDRLISCSLLTHNAIHYKPKQEDYIERKPNDTLLWER